MAPEARPARSSGRAEYSLLRQCARVGATVPPFLRDPNNAPLDWDVFLAAAKQHVVTDLLLSPLKAAGASVPEAVLSGLEQRLFNVTGLNLARTKQLAELLRQLNAHGIRALSYKGPSLAAGVYGHLGVRASADLDILVDRRCAAQVRSLLLADGYTLPSRQHRRTGSLLHGLYRGAGRDDTLLPPHERLASVDVHVAFSFWTQGIRLETDALFDRAVTVDVAGEPIPTLCPEDLLLVLAIHGMMHGWCILRLVSDVDAVTKRIADWDAVVRRARAARMRRPLWVALLLANDVLDTALPAEVVALATRDRQAVDVARTAMERLPDPVTLAIEQGWDPLPWFLSFQERPTDRARFHARRLMYEWFLKWPWDEWLGRRDAPVRSTEV